MGERKKRRGVETSKNDVLDAKAGAVKGELYNPVPYLEGGGGEGECGVNRSAGNADHTVVGIINHSGGRGESHVSLQK